MCPTRPPARPPALLPPYFLCPYSYKKIVTVVQAHVSLAALLRSDMRLPGIDSDGDWPPQAKRLAKLAWAFAYRVRKAGAAGASSLPDDDVMLLCQGAEVLEAAMECADDFFEGPVKCECFFYRGTGDVCCRRSWVAAGESGVPSACGWMFGAREVWVLFRSAVQTERFEFVATAA